VVIWRFLSAQWNLSYIIPRSRKKTDPIENRRSIKVPCIDYNMPPRVDQKSLDLFQQSTFIDHVIHFFRSWIDQVIIPLKIAARRFALSCIIFNISIKE
jgi:hypothetical protein